MKTGELIRREADDDDVSLAELVRQERFSAGAQDQKDLDYEMASRIAGDAKYQNDLDYADENAEKLARKKMKSDVIKKAFAVQGISFCFRSHQLNSGLTELFAVRLCENEEIS